MSKLIATSLLLCTLITGCVSKQTIQPIAMPTVATVQAEISRQVGVYMDAAQNVTKIQKDGKSIPVTDDTFKNDFWCGNGNIDFKISTIKVELTTTVDSLSDVQGGLSIPVSAVTLGPSGEHKKDVNNTQTLDYNIWSLPHTYKKDVQDDSFLKTPVTDAVIDSAPIAKALLQLRDGLVLSSMKHDYSGTTPKDRPAQPCFLDYDPDKPASDAGNTFKIGLSITNDGTRGFSVSVGILKFSDASETKTTTGNTLTVAFVQKGLTKIQYAKDAVDAECKYPNAKSDKCKQAIADLKTALSKDGSVGELIEYLTE